MGPAWRLLKNRDFVLVLGLASGLAVGDGAPYTRQAIIPALAVVMTLSTLGIRGSHLADAGHVARSALWGLVMNYLALSSLILALAALLPLEPAIREGFLIIAMVPPAVAIIPFSDFLGADRPFALLATMGAYLGALVVMPVMAMVHWGAGFVDPWRVVVIMLELIVAPLVISRVVLALGWEGRIEPYKGLVTNWCFFLVVYTIVGLNRGYLFGDPWELLPVAAVAGITTFGWGMVIALVGRRLGADRPRLLSLVLLGTLKNYGLAGGLALAVFESSTAVPAVVSTTFMVIYVVWLNHLKGWLLGGSLPAAAPAPGIKERVP